MGRAVPSIPFLPEAADPPPWFRVTPNRGVPAVLFRLDCTDVLAVPADVVAFGLPERVPAFGFVDVFVFDSARPVGHSDLPLQLPRVWNSFTDVSLAVIR